MRRPRSSVGRLRQNPMSWRFSSFARKTRGSTFGSNIGSNNSNRSGEPYTLAENIVFWGSILLIILTIIGVGLSFSHR